MVLDNRPCHTLYVSNLNDRVKKIDLKNGLYYLFNQYGKVIDLVAIKSPKLRGQAFISFKDIGHATVAMRALQGFLLFDKPMRLQFAKRDSTVVKRLKGGPAAAAVAGADKKTKAAAAAACAAGGSSQDDAEKRKKKITIRMMTEAESAAAAAAAAAAGASAAASADEPEAESVESNNVLLLENLPDETTSEMLHMLFSQVNGFKEARCIEGRADIAFVEYENDEQAKSAMDVYQGFRIDPEHAMRIKFAKK